MSARERANKMLSREARLEDVDAVAELIVELDELRAAVQRVREIHQPVDYGDIVACANCEENTGEVVPWPCQTGRALNEGRRAIAQIAEYDAAERMVYAALRTPGSDAS
jgi:hypothetical protein